MLMKQGFRTFFFFLENLKNHIFYKSFVQFNLKASGMCILTYGPVLYSNYQLLISLEASVLFSNEQLLILLELKINYLY